ncbi:MAG: jag family protein [Thermoleophilia bacterium]|nr:jag family protein [Thermoleophilia bacterium]
MGAGVPGRRRGVIVHLFKFCGGGAEAPPVSEVPPIEEQDPGVAADDGVRLEIVGGSVRIAAGSSSSGSAELTWDPQAVRVHLFGESVDGNSCRVPANAALRVEAVTTQPRMRYIVAISRDRMEATLRTAGEPGCARTLRDAPATARLNIAVDEVRLDPPEPDLARASAELQAAGVIHGIDQSRVQDALEAGGEEVQVATGTEPLEGRSGYLEQLVDFEALRRVGVLAETPLLRRVRKRDGMPGRDVTGRELAIPPVKDARIRPGVGVTVDEQGIMAIATVDGSPRVDSEGNVEVRHELVLEVVDAVSGDVEFNGSIRIEGDIGEGRRVIARDELLVEGNVDRAHLESGGSMVVTGSIMSSTLRAGGERAVAASIADRVLELPKALGIVAAQARQFRDQGASRGTDISHGLSVQLVLERIHRGVLPDIASVLDDLREAGPSHQPTSERVARWLRLLSTAANIALTPEQLQEILIEVSALAEDVRRATEQPADLTVNYMQACEAEATGTVTLVGKGIFNSRLVAWGGLIAQHHEAVFRGGSVVSHGRVHVREVGSPAGAKTTVQLGQGASVEADRAYAGTVVSGPGYTHRFVADRSMVRIGFDSTGSMNVESLAA